MPQSQLKRLKASLREQGIVGPQKSKKQKAKGLSTEQKIKRNVALEGIRENFNPFETKHLSRPAKRDITTLNTLNGKVTSGPLGRPGVTKSLGEQKRRQTLLLEVQNRNKVGGIVDRRIGEDDEKMGAEEKALQRYTWERQRKAKKGASAFDLEGGDDDGEELLTHGGRALEYYDDYDAASIEGSDEEDMATSRKRNREALDEMIAAEEAEDGEPDRKKSRAEIMDEVVKKSKLYKFERQRAKEEDDDVRTELDKDFADVRSALSAFQQALDRPKQAKTMEVTTAPAIHPDRVALMDGSASRLDDNSYDLQLKKIANDARAKPTDRIRTEEERAAEAAEKAQELENQRQRRMAGMDDDDSEREAVVDDQPENIFEPEDIDDAAEFGLQSKHQSRIRHTRPEGVDDEDDFLIEDDFIARQSESDDEVVFEEDTEDSEDDLLEVDEGLPRYGKNISCPRTLEQLEAVLKDVQYSQYHETIRSLRLRNDPAGHSSNKSKLEDLSTSLIELLAVLPSKDPKIPSEILDVVIRHIHSMARKSPDPISNAFREHLRTMHATKSMTPGDLVILTAIGAIYPTSDHFHQIVTPAIVLMARWLGLTTPQTVKDSTTGAFLTSLCLKYQSLSKRFIPELIRFTHTALLLKSSQSLLDIHISNIVEMANLWSSKSAFIEIFTPLLPALQKVKAQKALLRLNLLLTQSTLTRRPLLLHNHKPLAIKSAIPRYEEGFDPAKHYDPDADRAETSRLTREYKKEKKGAMRELRKDANFLAREKLREKKEKDRAYDDKYKRLVAEIQGEEGRESKAYDKERNARRGKR